MPVNPLLPVPALVQRAGEAAAEVLPARIFAERREESSFASREDFLRHLTHEVSNVRQVDGRINLGVDARGRVVSNSVSPYAHHFMDNVEDGVRDLVLALRTKRYLTYSSCEGHCRLSRRFVGIAFWSPEARDDFAKRIEGLGLRGVSCRPLDRVANVRNVDAGDGRISSRRFDHVELYDLDDETDGFNASFHRAYERYWFVELVIYGEAPGGRGFADRWRRIELAFLKRFCWAKTTRRVTAAIADDGFPVYKM